MRNQLLLLYVKSHFSLDAFNILVFDFQQFDYIMSRYRFLQVYPTWSLLILEGWITGFYQIWEALALSLQVFFCPFFFLLSWDSHVSEDTLDGIQQVSQPLFMFLYSSFRASRWVIPTDLSSQFCSWALWWTFHFAYCTFQLQNFYLFFFMIYWQALFGKTLFSFLFVFFFSSLVLLF